MKKFEHVPVYPKTKAKLDEVGLKLAQNRKKKNISYNEIIEYLISLEAKTEC